MALVIGMKQLEEQHLQLGLADQACLFPHDGLAFLQDLFVLLYLVDREDRPGPGSQNRDTLLQIAIKV